MNIRSILLLTIIAVASGIAQADPLTFENVSALQNQGNIKIDLFSNPGASLTAFKELTFTIDVKGTLAPGATDTLRVTYLDSLGGSVVQQFDFPLFGSLTNVTLFVTVNLPNINYTGIPASLTLDLLQSDPDFVHLTTGEGLNSFTYSFVVAEPVPEPTSLTLLSAAGSSLVVLLRRRSRAKDLRRAPGRS
jgi:hypothetical protein